MSQFPQSQSNLIIRSFCVSDFGAVVDLLQDVSAFRPDGSLSEALADRFAGQPLTYGVVAEQKGEIIGFASIFILERLRGGRSAVIEDVVVDRRRRGAGIGRALIDKLLDHARKEKCFKVTLEASADAEAFYCALGFVPGGTSMKVGL